MDTSTSVQSVMASVSASVIPTPPTAITNFSESVSRFLISSVLQPLSQNIEISKGVKVSVDEMLQMLNIPIVTKTSNPVMPDITNIAGYIRDIGNVEAKKSTRGRKKINKTPDPTTAKVCKYVFRGGTKRGQNCTEFCEEGFEYCNACRKRDWVKTQMAIDHGKVNQPAVQEHITNEPTICLVEHPSQKGYFIEQENHFVGRIYPEGVFIAEKIIDQNGERPLTEEEKVFATSRGFSTLQS